MLATFVIGLREGLEGALIIGIIAAFLVRRGRQDALRQVLIGVALAIAFCLAVAIALQVLASNLPDAAQEGLETVLGLTAVAMVTYMIVWMSHHAGEFKEHLESATSSALTEGSAWALVVVAVLAVLREGLETAVFLLAAFNASGSPLTAGTGAVLGLATAAVFGYGIYRGGVRLNLHRFFRATGLVLVLVAAGLVSTSLHTASEVGWVSIGQAQLVDASGLIQPGTVVSALLTGVLGMQPRPTIIEGLGWLAYLIPMTLVVLLPMRGSAQART
jgi:high-affinity iron transporter